MSEKVVKNYIQYIVGGRILVGPFVSKLDGVTVLDNINDLSVSEIQIKKANNSYFVPITNNEQAGPLYVTAGKGYYSIEVQPADADVLGSFDIAINYKDALPVKKACEIKRVHLIGKRTQTNGTITTVPANIIFDGENLYITITPNENYMLATFSINGVDKKGEETLVPGPGGSSCYGIPNVASDVEIQIRCSQP